MQVQISACITKNSYLSGQTVQIFGQALEKVQSYKYLGVMINSILTWSDHISGVCSKARQQLGLLYRQFYGDSNTSTLKALYITQVRPHLPPFGIHTYLRISKPSNQSKDLQQKNVPSSGEMWTIKTDWNWWTLRLSRPGVYIWNSVIYIKSSMGSPISLTHHSRTFHLYTTQGPTVSR